MARSGEASTSYNIPKRPDDMIVSGKRLDDRGFEEFRPACEILNLSPFSVKECSPTILTLVERDFAAVFDAGAHSKAAGSAYAEIGGTKAMIAV